MSLHTIIRIYWIILQLFIFFFKCITYIPRKIISLIIKLFKTLLPLIPSKYKPHFISYISNNNSRQNPQGFLNPTSNQCFANALLQCLYHLPPFQNLVLQTSSSSQNKILHHLSLLFKAIKSSSTKAEIHGHKKDLFEALHQYSPEVFISHYFSYLISKIPLFSRAGGDSRFFFISLMSSLRDSNSTLYQLFCEQQVIKKIECIQCQQEMRAIPLEIKEDSLLINIEESLYYRKKGIENLFQNKIQKRYCKLHEARTEHEVTVSIDKLPQILALRVADNPVENLSAENYKPHLTLRIANKSNKKILNYLIVY